MSKLFLLSLAWWLMSTAHASDRVPGEFVVMLPAGHHNQLAHLKNDSETNVSVIDHEQSIYLIRRPLHETESLSTQFLQEYLPDDAIIEPNFIYQASALPNDPNLEYQYGLLTRINGRGVRAGCNGVQTLYAKHVGMDAAWEILRPRQKVIVAVIDSGIDVNHPDLKSNLWVNQAEARGRIGHDDDSNGYVDDYYGFDFVANSGRLIDDNGHGTHVAGVIGAQRNNGIGIAGMSNHVALMGLRFLGASGGGALSNAVRAINYAVNKGARVINASWGGGGRSSILEKTIARAGQAGVLFVAAAGNASKNTDRRPSYPASYNVSSIISVASSDARGHLSSFSNYGKQSVELAAPGSDILSTYPGGYRCLSGTSMAAPFVTGALAAAYTHDSRLSSQRAKSLLLKTVEPLWGLKNKTITGGLLRVDQFIEAL